ncbi:hypothetical protein EOM82_08235 [bacterium]|nr:hypothetical protein [bacterium]
MVIVIMANITERKDKNGNINAYLIRVYRGKDAQGKQLKPYVMTWNPPDGWAKRSIEKELQKQTALFEQNCKLGNVSTEKQTFESYANYVIDLKESNGIKPHTIRIYRECLKRVIDINCNGIGYLKLQDIRAEHLNTFYLSLAKKGVTILVTTHFMDEAEFCDRISLFYKGEAIAIGTPAELKQKVNVSTMDEAFVELIKESEAR